jgi:hypothetical protein
VFRGKPVSIIFTVDANGANISGLTFPLLFDFTNGNIIGPVWTSPHGDDAQFIFSAEAILKMENRPFNDSLGAYFIENPDSLLWGALDFNYDGWTGSGEVARIVFTPLDTGSFVIDGAFIPPAAYISALDQNAIDLPIVWAPATINIPRQPGTVQARVTTSYGNDSLYIGGHGSIIFSVDWAGHEIAGVTFPLQVTFSNGNIIGPFSEPPSATTAEFLFSPYAQSVFESLNVHPAYAENFVHTPSDTILFGGTDLDLEGWTKSVEVARLRFYPLDTGTITIDEMLIPPTSGLVSAVGPDAQELPLDWQPVTFTVAPCPVIMGDVNNDGITKSSDLIYMVNYIFKSGPEPFPIRAVGDVNCTGGLTGADVIYLVNYIFKGGTPPCPCHVSNF